MADVYFRSSKDTTHEAHDTLCSDCTIQLSHLHEPLNSPVQHLLSKKARLSLSPTEEVQIREAISQAESKINGIDVTAAKIQRLLLNLAEERVRVQGYRDKHKVLVAPIWDIPPEILSYIFVLCLSHPPPNEIKRSSLKLPLLLAWVNQYWRQVALSTPQLWSTIFLDSKSLADATAAGRKPGAASSSTLCMPKVCLKRSGACPLSITVFSQEFNADILNFIIPISDRWRRISLNTNLTMLQSLSPIQGKLRRLEHLEIRNTQWVEGPHAVGLLSLFSDAPRLKHVMVSNTFQSTFDILPLQQITTWDSPVSTSDFPQIFKLAPNLEECFIQPLRMLNGPLMYENEITFSHNLTSLHISTGIITNLSVQLQHLPRFPCLRQLFLYCDKRVLISSPETTLIPFFAKSGGQLEYLMFGISVALDMIKQCLAHTPMLTSLHIHRVATDLVLNCLTLQEEYGDDWLVPKLETLRLSGKLYFPAQAVTKLIHSRWRSDNSPSECSATTTIHDPRPRNLRSVYILPQRQDRFGVEEKNELLALNQQGFEVMIRSLDRSGFLSHNTLLGFEGEGVSQHMGSKRWAMFLKVICSQEPWLDGVFIYFLFLIYTSKSNSHVKVIHLHDISYLKSYVFDIWIYTNTYMEKLTPSCKREGTAQQLTEKKYSHPYNAPTQNADGVSASTALPLPHACCPRHAHYVVLICHWCARPPVGCWSSRWHVGSGGVVVSL